MVLNCKVARRSLQGRRDGGAVAVVPGGGPPTQPGHRPLPVPAGALWPKDHGGGPPASTAGAPRGTTKAREVEPACALPTCV